MNFYATDFNTRSAYLHRNKSDISYFAPLIIHVTFHFAKVISQLTVLINDDAPLKNAGGPCKNSLRFSSLFGHFLRPESMRWWPRKDEFKIVTARVTVSVQVFWWNVKKCWFYPLTFEVLCNHSCKNFTFQVIIETFLIIVKTILDQLKTKRASQISFHIYEN